ncbi:MAG: hypothetical protein A4E63_00725 [Syntrophorhabdus sp. PtaU1.Bin050]|nr:MAG: hypothetical protein A4E63_00725 [Syntrophorhabdus sp. PtaU1.Bin050]
MYVFMLVSIAISRSSSVFTSLVWTMPEDVTKTASSVLLDNFTNSISLNSIVSTFGSTTMLVYLEIAASTLDASSMISST